MKTGANQGVVIDADWLADCIAEHSIDPVLFGRDDPLASASQSGHDSRADLLEIVLFHTATVCQT